MTTDFLPGEIGAIAHLAQNGSVEADARSRLKRLTQDRRPTTAASTGSWVNWGGAAEVLGQPFDMVKIPLSKLEQMRRDPMLAFGLTFVKVPLVRAPWYIKCSDPRIAAAVDQSLRRIYPRFIMAYTNAFDFGFSPMVKRFELDSPDWTYEREVDGVKADVPVWDATAQMLVWKPFTALNPRMCSPHWNAKGDFNGIDFTSGSNPFFNSASSVWPGANTPRQADVPVDWALWATNEKDSVFGSYWGYPRIGYAYRYWWAYWYRFGLADRAFERWADPPIMAFHPSAIGVDENNEPIDVSSEALGLAEQLRSGANVSMPSSVVTGFDERQTNVREWWLEQMESKADFEALNKAFEYLDVQKLRAVMVPEQALVEGKGGTSSRNVAATFGDVFQESQAVVKQEIDDQLNRYVIPQFVKLNFGETAPRAEIVTTGFDPIDVEMMREVVRLLGQEDKLSQEVDLRTILKQLGVPIRSFTDVQKAIEQAAEDVTNAPPVVPPDDNAAGLSEDGKYFKGRDKIFGGYTEGVWVREGDVEQPIYMREDRILLVPNGYTHEELVETKEWLLGEREKVQELGDSPQIEALSQQMLSLAEKVDSMAQQKPQQQPVNVTVQLPEKKLITKTEYTFDEDGLINGFTKTTEEVEDGEGEGSEDA